MLQHKISSLSLPRQYNPSEIQPMGRYTVRAQIFYGDRLRWTSTKMYPVINQGDSEAIEIQLEPVR